MAATESVLRAGDALTDPQVGVFRRVNVATSAPDEPDVYTASIDRPHPGTLTDGVTVPPTEGGCGLTPEAAVVSAIGEGVERYSSTIYREANLRTATYGELDSAVDPATVCNFGTRQREQGAVPPALYEDGDELRWVAGERLADGTEVAVPAQLVYLSYDLHGEPFVRAPISTGLAAGMDRGFAVRRGLLEIVERDAFMIHYLTTSPLPKLRVGDADGPIDTLTTRLDRAGIEWHVLDARTDIGLPVVVAVLCDESGGPAVSVAAAARRDAADAVQAALEEAIQTRFYQRHLLDTTDSSVSLADSDPEDIGRESRLLAWSRPEATDELAFWTDSTAETTPAAVNAATASGDVESVVGRTWELYTVDVTTPDIAETGFTVMRVVAPAAQPLYLRETNRYWDTARLSTVPMARGYRETPPAWGELNETPHPFP